MRKGFTLLELIIVIIIIGILATLGFTQYTKMVEKGRTAEAKTILGQLRSAEAANFLERNAYATVANLPIEAPAACVGTHYFSYACAAATGTCIATRCIAGGKAPNSTVAYIITVTQAGVWGGTPGYF